MKALRYLLIVIGLVSVLGVYAQVTAKLPEPKMQSTSGMMYSGSNLPQAAATGATLAEEPRVQSSGRPGHIRKVGEDDGFESETDPDVPENPYPLGDVFWPMMLLAGAYALMRVLLNRKRA